MESCPHCGSAFKGRTGIALKIGDHVYDADFIDRGEIYEIDLIESGVAAPGIARTKFWRERGAPSPNDKPIIYAYNLTKLFTQSK